MFEKLIHDYDFAKDIIKILLDKGIIAIIFIGISFYVSRLLENYKTSNAFSQVLFGHQVNAYNEIFEALINHYHSKQKLIETLYGIQTEFGYSEEVRAFENSEDYKARFGQSSLDKLIEQFDKNKIVFAEDIEKISSLVKKNSLFISSNFVDKISEYTNLTTKAFPINNAPIDKTNIDKVVKDLSAVDTNVKLILLQNSLREEINDKRKNPRK